MRQQAVVKDVPFYTAIKMTGRTTFGRFDSSKNHCLAPWGIGLRVVIIFAPALPDGTLATRAGWKTARHFSENPTQTPLFHAQFHAMDSF